MAIHGIYENGSQTWTHPQTNILWLRDLLPPELSHARVLAYHYNIEGLWSSSENHRERIVSFSTNLIAELVADRQLANAVERPIIFICHGFGGIVLEKALVSSKASTSPQVEHRRSIYVSTYGILFFGTPHSGIDRAAASLCPDHRHETPIRFISNLQKGSEMLQEVADQFSPLVKQFSIYYFWEQLPTTRRSSKSLIVGQESAVPPWHDAERFGIAATHSGMVKFSSRKDPGFDVVLAALIRYSSKADQRIKSRWASDRKFIEQQRQDEANALLRRRSTYRLEGSSSTPNVSHLHLIPRNPCAFFTGRNAYSSRLRDAFGLNAVGTDVRQDRKIFVIYGLGGSGKTQFCLNFARDSKSRYEQILY